MLLFYMYVNILMNDRGTVPIMLLKTQMSLAKGMINQLPNIRMIQLLVHKIPA